MEKKAVPEKGKRYNCYEDGKITPTRHYVVEITDVIPFGECADESLLDIIADEIEDYDFLFAKETDYIVSGKVADIKEPQYFIRTKDGGWFSLGVYRLAGRLDIDGSLTQYVMDNPDDFIYTMWETWRQNAV